jgi:hypothetical protein
MIRSNQIKKRHLSGAPQPRHHSREGHPSPQKGRHPVRSRVTSLIFLAALALAAVGQTSRTTSAAGHIPAGLDILHYAPSNGKVSALLVGKSFWPKERVHVTYRVAVRNAFQRTYQFDTNTDKFGAFQRQLRFTLGSPHYGYTLKVVAKGQRGDRATLNTWASGQGM